MNIDQEPKKLFMLRHGDTGMSGRYIGSTDLDLSDEGISQVRQTARALSCTSFDRVLCSPMIRCKKTLELLDLPVNNEVIDHLGQLREVNFGRWEEKTFKEILKNDQHLVEQWTKNHQGFCFPDGESIEHFQSRVANVATTIKKLAGKRILIISHGGVIRHLLCHFLKLQPINYLLFDIQPGAYTTVRLYDQGGVLTGLNIRG